MFSGYFGVSSTLRIGAYAAIIATITSLTGWSSYRIGATVVGLLDARIIDGSGRASPEPQWSAPPLASDPRAGTQHAAEASASTLALTRVSTDEPVNDHAAAFFRGGENSYKTYCVRLCDGFYWPISFSTTPARFEADASTCRSSCGSPARLFVHRIPGGGPGTMVALDGLPYTALKSAFLFRTRYDAQCRCVPQPWEEAARNRHKLFAAAEAAERGDVAAAAEAKRLKKKVAEERRAQIAARDEADRAASRELASLAGSASLSPPMRPAAPLGSDPDADVLRLGALEADPPKRGFVPASGSGRSWKDRVFGDN